MNIPINIQSCFLRDYCAKNGFLYVLPQTELINAGSTYILTGLLREISKLPNLIGMTSIFMLPYHIEKRLEILQEIDKNNNLEWHFPLESTICKTSQLLELTAEHTFLEEMSRKSATDLYKAIRPE
jgi:sporadic carbohydrate cluster protein (TIGR04323 family)